MTLETKHDTAEWTRLKEVQRLARGLAASVLRDGAESCDLCGGRYSVYALSIRTERKARELLKLTEASND